MALVSPFLVAICSTHVQSQFCPTVLVIAGYWSTAFLFPDPLDLRKWQVLNCTRCASLKQTANNDQGITWHHLRRKGLCWLLGAYVYVCFYMFLCIQIHAHTHVFCQHAFQRLVYTSCHSPYIHNHTHNTSCMIWDNSDYQKGYCSIQKQSQSYHHCKGDIQSGSSPDFFFAPAPRMRQYMWSNPAFWTRWRAKTQAKCGPLLVITNQQLL